MVLPTENTMCSSHYHGDMSIPAKTENREEKCEENKGKARVHSPKNNERAMWVFPSQLPDLPDDDLGQNSA